MTDRERLIKLLDSYYFEENSNTNSYFTELADYLLENGVMVSPCKVGDTVYQTDGIMIYESKIKSIIYDCGTHEIAFDETAIGKSIFLTREEAEQTLKEKKKLGCEHCDYLNTDNGMFCCRFNCRVTKDDRCDHFMPKDGEHNE